MNKYILTVMGIFLSVFLLTSCNKNDDTKLQPDNSRYISNYNFFMNGAQQIPSNTSTGSGRIEGTYDKSTKVYTYTVSWTGLSSKPTSMHIHGLADKGLIALPGTYANGIAQNFSSFATTNSGSYAGTLFVDGVAIRETDLLSGKFYVDIHTTNFPGGEIRGQILFP